MTYNHDSIQEISTMKTRQLPVSDFAEDYGILTPQMHPHEELVTRFRFGHPVLGSAQRLKEQVLRTVHSFDGTGTNTSSFDVCLTETEPMSDLFAVTIYTDTLDDEFIGLASTPAQAFEDAYNIVIN